MFSIFFYLFKLNSTRLADFNFQREIGCWFWQYAIFSQIILYRGQKTKDFIFLYYFAKTLPKSISKIQNHTITFLHFLFFVLTHPHPSAFTIFFCVLWLVVQKLGRDWGGEFAKISRELEYYIYFEYFLPAIRVKNKFIGKIKRFYKRLKKERLD